MRALREDIGLTGWPLPLDAWRLAAAVSLRGLIEVELGPCSYTAVRADGRRVVTLAEGPDIEDALIEEVAHCLFPRHPPSLFVPRGLALLNQDVEEATARRFVLAWRLPVDLLFGQSLQVTIRQSGCTKAEVRERLGHLGHKL